MANEVGDPNSGPPAGEQPPAPPQPRRCRACREPIEADATKCPKCQADQQPQHWFIRYWKELTGAALVILALLGGFFGLYDRFFPAPPAPANLDATLTCNQDRIVVKVRNSGGTVATIDRPSFRIYADGRWDELPIRMFVPVDPNDDSKFVVAPNAFSILRYPSVRPFEYFSKEQTGRDEAGRPRCQIGVTVPGLTRAGERVCECAYQL